MQPGIVTRARRVPAKILLVVAGVLLLVVFVTHWAVSRGAQERALRKLPDAERGALYLRTMENLRTVCARDGHDALREFCQAQAKVAVSLPECSADCQELAGRYLRGATR